MSIDQAADLLASPDTVVLAGSGVSLLSGLPLWPEFRDSMVTSLRGRAAHGEDIRSYTALDIGSIWESDVLPEERFFLLRKWFDGPDLEPNILHEHISMLPGKTWITTNFDVLLETAVRRRLPRCRVATDYPTYISATAADHGIVLKLHGCVSSPHTLALSNQSYNQLERSDMSALRALRDIASARTLVMIGYSASDPDLLRTLEYLAHDTASQSPPRYMITATDTSALRTLMAGYHITVISIPTHADLARAISKASTEPRKSEPLPTGMDVRDSALSPSLPTKSSSDVPGHGIVDRTVQLLNHRPSQTFTLPGQITELLQQSNFVCIQAPAGAGKTTLLTQIHSELGGAGSDLVRVSHLTHLRGQIKDHFQSIGSPERVLLVDGLDEAESHIQHEIVTAVSALGTSVGGTILTSRPGVSSVPGSFPLALLDGLEAEESWAIQNSIRAGTDKSEYMETYGLTPELLSLPYYASVPGVSAEHNLDTLLRKRVETANGGPVEGDTAEAQLAEDMFRTGDGYAFLLGQADQLAANLNSNRVSYEVADTSRLTILCEPLANLLSWGVLAIESDYATVVDRAAFEYLVVTSAAGSNRAEALAATLVRRDATWFGMLQLLLTRLSDDVRTGIMATLWLEQPRKLLGVAAGNSPWQRNLLLELQATDEDQLVALIRTVEPRADSPTVVAIGRVLLQLDVRNGNIAYFLIQALERICRSEDADRVWVTSAERLLDRFWTSGDKSKIPVTESIPAGSYSIGSDVAESSDEIPRHLATLDAFRIGRYPVTVAEYRAFCPAYEPDSWIADDDMPVADVNWFEATLFCRWVGASEGRLPTEAEWEAACRGPQNALTEYHWGDSFDPDKAHLGDSKLGPATVGSYPPNGFGLYDMSGNVYEWAHDWFDDDFYARSPSLNPAGPSRGQFRVMRGGSWGRSVVAGRSAYRVRQIPSTRDILVGFRLWCSTES